MRLWSCRAVLSYALLTGLSSASRVSGGSGNHKRDTSHERYNGANIAYDYGPAAERDIAAKRADYFTYGTLVVWDVDLLSEEVIKSYKASDPEHPAIFRGAHCAAKSQA